jgi:hypothetical protein
MMAKQKAWVDQKVWINCHTTPVTVDGRVFIVRTDIINKYGMEKVVEHIRQVGFEE